jgi:putative tryptophan/tyrosine transport system substrate-binding protein
VIISFGRRSFLAALGGTAAALTRPLAARAQQPERVRRIGVLQTINEGDPEGQHRIAVFVQGLQKLGWREGANLMIDYRFGATIPSAIGFTQPNS